MKKIIRLLRYDMPLHFVLLFTNWLPDNVLFLRFRGFLAQPFFKKCGKNLRLGRNLTLYDSSKIVIGNNVYIAYGCWFSAGFGVDIEDEVMFGPYNVVATSNHTKLNNSYRYGNPKGEKITIKKGSWIGAHCTLLSGSIVGIASVIGANTVVKGIVEDNAVFSGQIGTIKNSLK